MENKKKVDEAWKEKVRKEKEKSEGKDACITAEKKKESFPEKEDVSGEKAHKAKPGTPLPDPDFSTFISGLGMQALMLLGEFSHPQAEDKIEPDYQQAKYTIDLIDMLKKKTEGNLTREEADLIDNLLYDLRMRYLKHV